MFYVYILESGKDQSYYIGSTHNIDIRLNEHNYGRTGYSKLKRPWRLIYKEDFQNRSGAMKREKYLKNLKNKKYLEALIKKNFAA